MLCHILCSMHECILYSFFARWNLSTTKVKYRHAHPAGNYKPVPHSCSLTILILWHGSTPLHRLDLSLVADRAILRTLLRHVRDIQEFRELGIQKCGFTPLDFTPNTWYFFTLQVGQSKAFSCKPLRLQLKHSKVLWILPLPPKKQQTRKCSIITTHGQRVRPRVHDHCPLDLFGSIPARPHKLIEGLYPLT